MSDSLKISRKGLTRSQYMKKVYRYSNDSDRYLYKCIDDFKRVPDPQKWALCPNCGLIPKVWEFDNGRFTACGCGKNRYRHHSVRAESIRSVMRNSHNGMSMIDYNHDELRINWNHWVSTGEHLFEAGDGRW